MIREGDDSYLVFKSIWIIENFSYCLPWMKLKSPPFTVSCLGNTKWQLIIRLRGDLDPIYITYELCREDDDATISIDIDFELSFLNKDGIPLTKQKTGGSFRAKDILGFSKFLELEEITLQKRKDFIPNDALTARCLLWSAGIGRLEPGLCLIRSRMGLEQSSFNWIIESFSSLQPGQKRILQIQTTSKQVPSLSMILSLVYDDEIRIEITQERGCETNMSDCEISLVDGAGRVVRTKRDKYFFVSKQRDKAWIFPSFLKKNYLTTKKGLYLPNDELTLKCVWKIDSGIVSHKIEEFKQYLSSNIQSIAVHMNSFDYSKEKI
ncbi:MATH domain-containing protein [Nephila pilipes]|uniref:MATH domain-containing protein n=1 Tax=Nephila pilipes TaxID=299642 RepID=A0A8X6TSQ0_NEPPI|nr:MATH domain-containing protein [Nephila pilipes]